MQDFTLHPRLVADTAFVTDWMLSRVLLMDDMRYPWVILVPRRPHLVELFDLTKPDRALLVEEITRAAQCLKTTSGATKINVGALGNQVPQLHVHVVARQDGDTAWPGPVWGHSPRVPYHAAARNAWIARFLNSS